MMIAAETELVEKLKDPRSRSQAFDQLVRQYQRMLYFHIRRMVIDHDDADDVLQNTLLKAWKYIDRFRAESALKTWLYRIATNEALSFLNKRKKQQSESVSDIQNDLRHSLEQGRYIDGDEIQMKLQRAILQLPERQRAVFNLRYFDEMKYDEIAEILGVSVGSLKASYHHAVKKIEKYLSEA
ncbi:MAG: RNA polymerase sigma factor [Bacteroidetes bacterium]|nr:MAG: RNA polymerase sigma factor [Bacteroidota bacterium]